MKLFSSPFALALILLLAAEAVAGDDVPLTVRDYQIDALISESREPTLESIGLGHSTWWAVDAWGDDADRSEGEPAVHRFLYEDDVVELIRSTIAPASWEEEGAFLDAGTGRLTVGARKDVQDAVADLLASLWEEAGRRVRVDVRLVRLGAEAATRLEETGVEEALRSGRLDASQVKALLDEAASVLAGTTISRPGRRTTVSQVNSVSYVRDFDVEIAQGSIVGDPIVGWIREGLSVDVRPHLLAGGDFFLEALGHAAGIDRPVRRVNLEGDAMGTVDLPACGVTRFFTAGRVALGESLAVVRREASGSVEVTLLTPSVIGPARAAAPLRFFPVSALLWRRIGYEVTDRREEERRRAPEMTPPLLVPHADGPGCLDGAELREIVAARVLSEAREEEPLLMLSGGRLAVRADPELTRGVAAMLAKLEESAVRTWRVHVRVFETSGSEAPGKLLAAFHLDTTPGRRVCAAAGVERAYVADWDVEVAQEARVGDPIIGHAFGGATLNLRLDATGVEGRIAAHLDMLLSTLAPEFETRRTGNAVTGIIEIPKLARVRLERELVLTPGETVVIDGGLVPTGRSVRVELTVE